MRLHLDGTEDLEKLKTAQVVEKLSAFLEPKCPSQFSENVVNARYSSSSPTQPTASRHNYSPPIQAKESKVTSFFCIFLTEILCKFLISPTHSSLYD